MGTTKTAYGSFEVEKRYNHPAEKVFSWFSDKEKKKAWFVEQPKENIISYDMDFRVGGKESSRWKFSGGGPIPEGTVIGNDTVYLDIVENKRIVIAYTMLLSDYRFSCSLLTFEFIEQEGSTLLKMTEQGAYFENSDDPEMRKEGWTVLLNCLFDKMNDG